MESPPQLGGEQWENWPEAESSIPHSPSSGLNHEPHSGSYVLETEDDPEASEHPNFTNESSFHQWVKDDDGSRRYRMLRPLRFYLAALVASGKDLETSEAGGAEGQKKRKRNKKKSDVRQGRGIAKPRNPTRPNGRLELMVVGDKEFTCSPLCTKVITTVRLLALENMPGPYRTYNMFPINARLDILQKFLQRYSWASNQNVGRCLDVYENIASEAYSREMAQTRRQYTKKYGQDKEV